MYVMSAALGASVNVGLGHRHFAAIVAVVRGDSVSPPKLTGYAPIADVFHPVEISIFKSLGDKLGFFGTHRFDCRLCKRLHLDEPLLGHERFHRFAATIASADVVRVRLDFHHKSERGQILDYRLSCGESVHSLILAGVFVHKSVLADNLNHGQVVAQAEFEVVGVVRRRDFNRARTEADFAIIVRNDGYFSVRKRKFDEFADVFRHFLVFGVDRNRRVAEHSFGTRRRNDDCVVLAYDGILVIPKIGLLFFVFDLCVAERGVTMRTPVDYAVSSVNQTFFVVTYKRFQNRVRAVFVHSESGLRPVARNAECLLLLDDSSAVLLFPRPSALQESFSADVVFA